MEAYKLTSILEGLYTEALNLRITVAWIWYGVGALWDGRRTSW